jgi:hypothetical protein
MNGLRGLIMAMAPKNAGLTKNGSSWQGGVRSNEFNWGQL